MSMINEESSMSFVSKDYVRQAMARQKPRHIPVMCQLTIGNILLNTGVVPIDFNFTNDGYAEGAIKARELYDFDGILLHKPGREESIMDFVDHIEDCDEGKMMVFKDGGVIINTYNDDPKYYPSTDTSGAFEGFPNINDVNMNRPFDWMPESFYHWCIHKGLHPWKKVEDFPDYYYATIDRVLARVGDTYSVHGETKAPSDYLFNYLGLQNSLISLIESPDKCKEILDYFTENCIAWSVAQIKRGCDAIKISSPYAGGSFISREHYKEFIFPYEKRLADAVKAAGGYIYTHTCGSIGDRLDLIVESGVSGIECLDPPPLGNVELKDAIDAWQDKIFIKGNVDSVNTLLLKSRDGVIQDIEQILAEGSKASGYIMSTACSVAPAVPKENLQAMVEVVRKYNQTK